MHILGIVGGVASGKSLVAARLAELGAVVLDADKVAHEVLREEDMKKAIGERFGGGVLDERGELDRAKLARIVFAEGEGGDRALRDLENIVHPRIGQRLRERVGELDRAGQTDILVLDAAVMLKAGWDEICDTILFVDAPRQIRIARAAARGWSADDLDARDARQTPIQRKRSAADVIIDNSGNREDTLTQVDRLWEALRRGS